MTFLQPELRRLLDALPDGEAVLVREMVETFGAALVEGATGVLPVRETAASTPKGVSPRPARVAVAPHTPAPSANAAKEEDQLGFGV